MPTTYTQDLAAPLPVVLQAKTGSNATHYLYSIGTRTRPIGQYTSAWKTFTSANHHYVVNYPADWTIDVQTSGPRRDPEYVYLRPLATSLPMVEIYALKSVAFLDIRARQALGGVA